jgi:hypothetical protein
METRGAVFKAIAPCFVAKDDLCGMNIAMNRMGAKYLR